MPSFSHSWLPFIYLYAFGGLFFFTGIYIIRKSHALNMKRKSHRYWFKVLIFGFIYFMIIHTLLIIAALYW
ncbi:MAG: hypothetical protein C4539_03675 [Ignavibacteriales bacterium]|nr:MAG: hypothetical protein C4539_03675 [Ignavibacteriales bacterium]